MTTQSAQLRIKDLEQVIREKYIALMGLQAKVQGLQSKLSITEREKARMRDQSQTLSVVAIKLGLKPGPDAIRTVPEAVLALVAERDRLLDGYPEGMTTADVEKLKAANAGLAAEIDRIRDGLDNTVSLATHAAKCQVIFEITERWASDDVVTVEQVIDLLATDKEVAA